MNMTGNIDYKRKQQEEENLNSSVKNASLKEMMVIKNIQNMS